MISLEHIAESYLRSFNLKEKKKRPKNFVAKKKKKQLLVLIKVGELTPGNLDKRTQSEVLFSSVLNYSHALAQELDVEEPLIERGSWDDFNLIYGNTATPNKTLHSYINRTRTTAGACVMATELVNPKNDIQAIQNKQEITKLLTKEIDLTRKLDENLATIQQEESTRLSLWQEENHLTHKEYKKELDSFYFKRFGLQKYNQSTWKLQLGKIWKDLWGHWGFRALLVYYVYVSMFSMFAGATFTRVYGLHVGAYNFLRRLPYVFYSDLLLPGVYFFFPLALQHHFEAIGTHSDYESVRLVRLAYQASKDESIYQQLIWLNLFSSLVAGLFFLYLYYKKVKKNHAILSFLAAHLAPLQDFLRAAQNISNLVASHPELEKLYGPQLVHTRHLLQQAGKKTPEGQLVYNLQVCKIRDRYYFFSNAGRLLATYTLFQEHKDCLADAIYEMGKFDTQLSVVKLMQAAKAYSPKHNHYVFPELTTEMPQGNPLLVVEKMWNPGLDAKKAVWNDLKMEDLQLIIVTGPNAGGKSVFALGTGLLVILSQVYGIVPAKHCKHTVFYKLLSYVNPTQNLAAGLSLAEAGMEVLKSQKNAMGRIQDLPMLAIMDEILNGVDPKVSEDLSYRILQKRYDDFPNLVQILTTHYRKLTELEKHNKKVVNKSVDILIPGKGGRKYDYTYKIVDGISPPEHNVAQEMLVGKGVL